MAAQGRLQRLMRLIEPLDLLYLKRTFERSESLTAPHGTIPRGTPLVSFCASVLERLLLKLPDEHSQIMCAVDLVRLADHVDIDGIGRVLWKDFIDFIVLNAAGGRDAGGKSVDAGCFSRFHFEPATAASATPLSSFRPKKSSAKNGGQKDAAGADGKALARWKQAGQVSSCRRAPPPRCDRTVRTIHRRTSLLPC